MGHAAMLAIEDVMIRYHRMKRDRTLWVPGTDHAAVATESKVENKLIKEEGFKKPKEELGREEFLNRVNKFAQDSHDTIVNQCKKMGASLDWSREAYTLDEQRNLAVRTVFKKMYDDGLIYRGYRVINWSVKGQSTCSDDELVHVERPAKLYYFKYSKDFPITIATTRPETKLGDTAVAVHPKDERYQKYIGKIFTVDVGAAKPLNIKIIADENVDKDFGTGALGVTPAHSSVDFEMYQKQKLNNDPIELIQVIGEDGRMTTEAGKDYVGLTVEEAREKFVAYLKAQNLLEKEEDIVQNVGTSDRFGDVVEALPKTQWFVDVNKQVSSIKFRESGKPMSLKEAMQLAVNSGDIKIVPDRFEKIYFNWINNLRDWCISRQIWFGHRIPVWYCISGEELRIKNQELRSELCGKPIVSIDLVDKCIGCGGEVRQDPDTLDTWFSSGLWTFSTLGYPNETLDLKNFHPTSVLETGYDILFFWVARMILMTTYTLGVVPFKTVYLHGLVRDEKGKKMSKSLGNIIDPLDMIEKYGTDATRLSLLLGNTPGNDMKLSEEKIAGFRNFTNKLWNISRFIQTQVGSDFKSDVEIPQPKTLHDAWILQEIQDSARTTTFLLEKFGISQAGESLKLTTWDFLADRYLEVVKIEKDKTEMLNYVLNTLLKLWHPFMPFVTETIWQEFYGSDSTLMIQKWPFDAVKKEEIKINFNTEPFEDPRSAVTFVWDIISLALNFRSENKIEPKNLLNGVIVAGSKIEFIKSNLEIIKKQARFEDLAVVEKSEKIENAVCLIWKDVEIWISRAGAVDTEKEKNRITKELDESQKYFEVLENKLSNEQFVNNAPEAVVSVEKAKMQVQKEKIEKLKERLKQLL
jgi:valyl-tRNA synthetase